MENPIVISIDRKVRPSEVFLRRGMAVLAAFFLLEGIMLSSGFMLPCFLMTAGYFVYKPVSKREYEYILENRVLTIERVSDYGRNVIWEIPFSSIQLLCRPDSPEAAPYRRGGSIPVKKYDYTSYLPEIPYFTLIAKEAGKQPVKLLLDLTPEAIDKIRKTVPESVRC